MMHRRPARFRIAERMAGLASLIAALIVLNGAWVNQHDWQNISWRVAVAALLVSLAVVVEASASHVTGSSSEDAEASKLPEFMRVARHGSAVPPARNETADLDAVTAGD